MKRKFLQSGGGHTTMTYYDDVRVPAECWWARDAGWKLITLQLNHERIGLAAPGLGVRRSTRWSPGRANDARGSGEPVVDEPWVQIALAEAWARLEAQKVWNWRIAWELERACLDPARASAAKVYAPRLRRGLPAAARRIEKPARSRPARRARCCGGQIEVDWRGCQINTFGGGVNEIQREIVAMVGLGLPRAPRQPEGARRERAKS